MKYLIVIFLYFFSHSAVSFSSGGEVGNGGQETALSFTVYGLKALEVLQQHFMSGSPGCSDALFQDLCKLDIPKLQSMVQTAKILAVPELKQVEEKTGSLIYFVALNYPQDLRIIVSDSAWNRPDFCDAKKIPLALHEYLGLLGIEIQNYRYSSLLSTWLLNKGPEDLFIGCEHE